MPRYFFSTHIGDDVVADENGTDLRDPDQAWQVARDTIQTTLRDAPGDARLLSAILVVTDEDDEIVLEFPFAEAIPFSPGSGEALH